MKMASVGTGGILLIIVGIILTSYLEKKNDTTLLKPTKSKAITCLLLSSLALTVYVTLPQAFQTSGAEVLFPQAI